MKMCVGGGDNKVPLKPSTLYDLYDGHTIDIISNTVATELESMVSSGNCQIPS